MPLPIDLSHRLVKKQADVMKSGEIKWLRPDAKSQVSVIYSDDGKLLKAYLLLFFLLNMMKMLLKKKLKLR